MRGNYYLSFDLENHNYLESKVPWDIIYPLCWSVGV